MEQIQNIRLTIAQRTVEFGLEIDPEFIQDRNLIYCLRADGCCEPEVAHVMFRVLKDGDVAVDAGAAVGFFTCLMAKLVGETGTVLAVEPAANNIVKLKQNIRVNNLKNVTVSNRPLWFCETERPFYMYDDSGSNSLQPIAGQFRASPVLRTQTLADLCGATVPKLIKIDCEGAESHIISGAVDHFGNIRAKRISYVLMELNKHALDRFDRSPKSIMIMMFSRGYQMFLLHRDGVLPTYIPSDSYEQLQFTRPNTNVLFSTWDKVLEAWPEIQT